jgi:hypothetical protein
MKTVLGAVLGTALFVSAAEAAVTFTDRADFLDAVEHVALLMDDFDNDIASGQSITFDSGIVSENSLDLDDPFLDFNFVDNGAFQNTVGSTAGGTNVFNFSTPIYAFGADFSTETSGLTITLGGPDGETSFNLDDFLDESNFFGRDGFFGVLTDQPITQIAFSTTDFFGTTFEIDNLVAAEVPLPAAAPLFGLALAGASFWRRRRHA